MGIESGGKKEPAVSITDAIAEIGVLRQNAAASGAVDSEHDAYSQILIDVMHGKLTPQEGIAKARKIDEERSQYH